MYSQVRVTLDPKCAETNRPWTNSVDGAVGGEWDRDGKGDGQGEGRQLAGRAGPSKAMGSAPGERSDEAEGRGRQALPDGLRRISTMSVELRKSAFSRTCFGSGNMYSARVLFVDNSLYGSV